LSRDGVASRNAREEADRSMQTPGNQSAVPPADTIRETAREVISRPYYELGLEPRRDNTAFLRQLIEWLVKPFRWLYDSMEGWPEFIRWVIVVGSLLVCAALITHIIYSFVTAIRGPVTRRRTSYVGAEREMDPADLERDAEQAGKRGDYIGAIRLLFRAALRRMELAEKKKLRPGSTNREILRRYRSTPVFQSLERFVETIDQKWYGAGACGEQDYLACHGEAARIRAYAEEPRPAVGA
jgi:hypothetical protein